MKDFLSHLNKQQYDAATTIDGPLLIIAGAGSGKTLTLVSRIANMIDEGIDPQSILLLTFTNKAAKEMRDRVIRDVGISAVDVTACTFHSFCANFLRKHAHLLSIDNNFTIIDGPDAAEVMSIAKTEYIAKKKEMGITYDPKDFPNKKEIATLYSNSINNCEKLADVILGAGYGVYYEEIKEIVKGYIEYKKKHSFFDYDDLLLYTKRILENYESVREKLGNRYKYVCCDEYQDTNVIQDAILNLMCKDHRNLAVVGDDNQSIYKFRGARIENILTFDKRYPDCKTVVLYENYRSSQEILDLANAVMGYATEGVEKKLHGQFNGVKPKLMVTYDDTEESRTIYDEIIRNHNDGTPLKEMAVIVRNSSQSYGLESILDKNGIPYDKFGGLKFLEKTVVRDIISFLRIFTSQKDEIAMFRILQLYPGIGKGYSNKIKEEVFEKGVGVLPTLYTRNKFYEYLMELYNTIKTLENKSVQEQLSFLLEEYYLEVVERSIDMSKVSESEKLEQKRKLYTDIEDAKTLYVMAEQYKRTSEFLEDIVLDSTMNDKEEDKLNITTIHSAKGLEYDIVFFMDVIEQITPKCPLDSDENPEELRCVYVALTRARKKLYLFAPKQHRNPQFNIYKSELSRFINEDDIIECMSSNVPKYDICRLRNSYDIWDID